jgi:tetratricopeptide (TPR) repeat protein
VAEFTAASTLMPDNPIFMANAGITLQSVGSPEPAIALLRLAVSQHPRLGYAYTGLGNAYRRLGDEKAARAEFRRALEVLTQDVEERPLDRQAWSQLAGVQQCLGDYRRAAEARAVLKRIETDALYEGDSRHVLAGPVRPGVSAEAE